jgi:hypothetical protein
MRLLKLLHTSPWPLIEKIAESNAALVNPRELERLLTAEK